MYSLYSQVYSFFTLSQFLNFDCDLCDWGVQGESNTFSESGIELDAKDTIKINISLKLIVKKTIYELNHDRYVKSWAIWYMTYCRR